MSYINFQHRRVPFAIRYVGDLLTYRHLCWNLVGSDLRARFRRTRLGVLWAIIQPLIFALMIATVWGAIQKTASHWEYAVYVLTGMVVFDLFSVALSGSQAALHNAAGFVKQARIPFFIFQLRVVITGVVIFFLGLIGVVLFSTAVGYPPALGPNLLLVPGFVGVAVLFVLPIAMIMSLIGVLYRDVEYISNLAERALYFLSPVMLPREIMAQPHLRFLEFVNPLVPFLDMFRDPMMYGRFWDQQDIIVMGIWVVALWTLALVTAASVGRKVVFAL